MSNKVATRSVITVTGMGLEKADFAMLNLLYTQKGL
jgi:hypothetical protein